MELGNILLIIPLVANLILGLLVYLTNKKEKTNLYFSLVTLSSAFWTLTIILGQESRESFNALLWTKLSFFGPSLIPILFVYFAWLYPPQTADLNKYQKVVFYLPLMIFLSILPSNLIVQDIIIYSHGVKPVHGRVLPFFFLYFVVYMVYGFYILIRKYNQSAGIQKMRIKYVFLAVFIAALIGTTSNLALPLLKITRFHKVGPFSTTIMIGIIAYAIVKHQLLDIRVVVSKGFTYATLVGAISGIYVLTVGVFQGIFGTTVLARSPFLVNAIAAMIIAASFQTLKSRIRYAIDKLFFKEKYNPQKIIKEFTWALGSFIEKDRISRLLVTTVTETLHLAKGSLFLFERESGRFRINASQSLGKEIMEKIFFTKDDFLPQWLREKDKIFIREEYEFSHTRQKNTFTPEIRQTLEKMKESEIFLSIPLKIKNELVGMLNLGSKMSGEMFTPEDLEFLTTLANQTAVALENARLYQEMWELEKNLHRSDKLTALGTLAANIAHEVKNPLVAIKTFTQLFPKKFNDPEFREKYNQIVPQELERLENILHELLHFSRPSKDQIQPIEIKKIIDEIILFMDSEILGSKVKVIREYQDDLPKIPTNPDQMKQVFVNLILNALQAMPEGGVLTITAILLDGQLNVGFSDTGKGIAEENMKNLFKPFFSTKEDGTGLGLAIVKQIIKEHNGTIEVLSKPQQGTTFLIKLPLPE